MHSPDGAPKTPKTPTSLSRRAFKRLLVLTLGTATIGGCAGDDGVIDTETGIGIGMDTVDSTSGGTDTDAEECPPQQVGGSGENCGNGVVDAGENCDDGNLINGDGCEVDCTFSLPGKCGDGIVNFGEECDDCGDSAKCNSKCEKKPGPEKG